MTETIKTPAQYAIESDTLSPREAIRANDFLRFTKAHLVELAETMLDYAMPVSYTKARMATILARGIEALPKVTTGTATSDRYREYLGTLLDGFLPVGHIIDRMENARAKALGVPTDDPSVPRVDVKWFEKHLVSMSNPWFRENWTVGEIGSDGYYRVWLTDDGSSVLQLMNLPGNKLIYLQLDATEKDRTGKYWEFEAHLFRPMADITEAKNLAMNIRSAQAAAKEAVELDGLEDAFADMKAGQSLHGLDGAWD